MNAQSEIGHPKSQADLILDHLQTRGPITALDALDEFGCLRLAARIKDLRDQGHHIRSTPTRTPKGATIAKYTLLPRTQPELF